MSRFQRIGRSLIVLVGTLVAAAVGVFVFVMTAADLADIVGILLTVGVAVFGARVAGRLASLPFAPYDVASVTVQGPITRDGRGLLPRLPGVRADDVVEQIELADADRHARALVVELNTPGGEVVPSDDIRRAVEAFDGPTVAYATDVCASGGYWIASGCDHVIARDAGLVGSIGVIGSRINAHELAERVGVSYERLAAGRFKDAGVPLKDWTDEERAYLQGLVDDFYESFVDRVSEGRDLEADEIRGTEARVYLGREAAERGLVDAVGTEEDAEDYLADRLDLPEVRIEAFEPARGFRERLGGAARSVAYAFGAGIAGTAAGREFEFELR